MLIFNVFEGFAILNGFKTTSLRPIRANGRGYCRVGAIHEVRTNRNFKAPFLCKILITAKEFVNIEDLGREDFKALGYQNKAEYMEQPYNRSNPDPERVRYSFICLDTLLRWILTEEQTLELFHRLWNSCRISPELSEGVTPELVFDGCDCRDLENQIQRLKENIIRGMM